MATRFEKVVLSLDDDFTSSATRAAAASALLDRQLDKSSGTVRKFGDDNAIAGKEIDKLSGRVRIFADAAALIGPALAPLSTVAVAGLAGLTNQLGFAVIAGGTAILAFQGVGDALKAVNAYQLEPTAANLEKMNKAMAKLGPAGRDFVRELQAIRPQLQQLQTAAQAGLFPGMTDSIESLMTRLPEVENIITAVSTTVGDLLAEGGAALAGPEWDDFFTMLESEARPTLTDLGHALGDVTRGLAELWIAFAPLNRDFGGWLADSAADFADWADGLSQTQGFAEFVDYVRTSGPQVAGALGAIANMVLQIAEAAAPLGGPVLNSIAAIANVLSAVADSDLGSPIFTALAALALYNRALALTGTLSKGAFASGPVMTGIRNQRTAVRGMLDDYRGVAVAQRQQVVAQQEYAAASAKYNRQLQTFNTQKARPDLLTAPSGKQQDRLADSLDRVQKANAAVVGSTERVTVAEGRRRAAFRETAATAGKAGAAVAALAILSTDAGDKLGLTNTASLALAGSMVPYGAAVGAAVGFTIDLVHANDDLETSLAAAKTAMKTGDVDALSAAYDQAQKAQEKFGFDLNDTSVSFGEAFDINPARNMNIIIGTLTGSLAKYRGELEAVQGVASADGAFGAAAGLLDSQGLKSKGIAQVATAVRQLDSGMLSTADSASKLATALASLIGPGLSAEEATDKYRATLRGLNGELKASAGFTSDTKGAQKNREVTRGFMTDLTDMITKQAEAGASAGKIARTIKQARTAFIEEGVAAGFSAKEMGRRADKMKLTPKLIRTVMQVVNEKAIDRISTRLRTIPREKLTKIIAAGIPKTEAGMKALQRRYKLTPAQVRTLALLRDQTPAVQRKIMANLRKVDGTTAKPKVNLTDNASSKIASISQRLGALNGKTAFTTAWTIYKTTGPKSARGNLFPAVHAYAYGDVADRHQPELAGPGPTRVWRERETMGEAYIPLANDDRRPRAKSILEETASIMGGAVEWYARGGGRRRSGSSAGLTAAEKARAARSFDVGTLDVSQTVTELRQFEATIKKSGGRVGRNFDVLSKRIVTHARVYDTAAKTLANVRERQTSARDAGAAAFNNNIFAGSAADLRTQLEADRNDSSAAASAAAAVRGKGLSGDFAAGLAGSGNVALARELANMSRAQLVSLQGLYNQRTSAQTSLGNQAAAAYSSQVAALTRQMADQTRVLNTLEKAVERGAANGTSGKARVTTTKTKARG